MSKVYLKHPFPEYFNFSRILYYQLPFPFWINRYVNTWNDFAEDNGKPGITKLFPRYITENYKYISSRYLNIAEIDEKLFLLVMLIYTEYFQKYTNDHDDIWYSIISSKFLSVQLYTFIYVEKLQILNHFLKYNPFLFSTSCLC